MTILSYLDDSYAYESSSEVTELGRDDRGAYVVLDQTIFYPQGGGQPADKGFIASYGNQIAVGFVGFIDGKVRHYIADEDAVKLQQGAVVDLRVDGQQRQRNARLHSAGHLISHIMETLDDRLIPFKGHHFPDGSYVECQGEIGDTASLVEQANARLAANIEAGLLIVSAYADYDTIAWLRPALAANMPAGKPTRLVTIGDYRALPCGGTHVSSADQLGGVRITKAKAHKGNLKVSYEIPGNQA